MPTSMLMMVLIAVFVLLSLFVCAVLAPRLPVVVRLLAACLIVPLTLFSLFGLLASFEPGDGHRIWVLVYSLMIAGSLAAIIRLVMIRKTSSSIDA
jgi:hypothetical protein